MKLRKEKSGYHFFDRASGYHILLDEISVPKIEQCIASRTVSIALTNICDLKCHFCYAPKNSKTLDYSFLQELAVHLDELGVLELTFGGGEPFLYPRIVELCKWIWDNTSLGISITTHGHHLNKSTIENLKGCISMLRLSIDGLEPYYSSIRGRPLKDLLSIVDTLKLSSIPFGINTVISKDNVLEAEKVINLAKDLKAENILLIPENIDGNFSFDNKDWEDFEFLISKYSSQIEICVTSEASKFIQTDFLPTEEPDERVFSHISADRKLKFNSHVKEGEYIDSINNVRLLFEKLYQEKMEINS